MKKKGVAEMKRDKEWLKEKLNTEKYYRGKNELKTKTTYGELYDRGVSDGINVALELVEQLNEPQKPVIPQFVADWIESRDYYNVYKVLQDLSASGSPHASKDVRNWIFCNQENVEKFVRAWLDGYEVEKEQLYRIKFSDNQYASRFNNEKISSVLTDEELAAQYTEAEIKAIDERYWAFAEEVTE